MHQADGVEVVAIGRRAHAVGEVSLTPDGTAKVVTAVHVVANPGEALFERAVGLHLSANVGLGVP